MLQEEKSPGMTGSYEQPYEYKYVNRTGVFVQRGSNAGELEKQNPEQDGGRGGEGGIMDPRTFWYLALNLFELSLARVPEACAWR
jgi:hypothetical protein